MVSESPSLLERRAVAEAAIAANKVKSDQAAELRAVVLLETQAKYELELGPLGSAFEIVDAGVEGPIVVKTGPMVLYKEYRASILNDKMTIEAAQKYILPNVAFPDRATLLDILTRRPVLHDEIVVKLNKLHGANEASEQGKS